MAAAPGKLVVRFDDQSTMQVTTGRIANIFPPGGKVKVVQEDGPEFRLQFEDDSTASFQLADPGSIGGKNAFGEERTKSLKLPENVPIGRIALTMYYMPPIH